MLHPSLDCVNILYHSAFYTFFLDAALSNTREVVAAGSSTAPVSTHQKEGKTSSPGKWSQYVVALRVLASIGCESAMDVVRQIEEEEEEEEAAAGKESTDRVVSAFVSASSSLLAEVPEKTLFATTESTCYSSAAWMHQFQLQAVAQLDLHRVPTTYSSEGSTAAHAGTTPHREEDLLNVLRSVHHRNHGGGDGASFRHTMVEYLADQLRYALERKKKQGENGRQKGKEEAVTELPSPVSPGPAFPLLFSWQSPPMPEASSCVRSPAHPSDRKRSRDGEKAQEESAAVAREVSLEVAWREGHLFGALAFLEGFTVTSALAKLLVFFMFSPPSRRGSSVEREEGPQRQEEEAEWYYARASGVVAGILEMALDIARAAVPRALSALHRLLEHDEKASTTHALSTAPTRETVENESSQKKKEETPNENDPVRDGGSEGVGQASAWRGASLPTSSYPLPEESVTVLVNAGMLLARLVEYASLYEDERRRHEAESAIPPTPGTSSPLSAAASWEPFAAATLGEVVAHVWHLLLVSLLTGCGTTHLAKPLPDATSRASVAVASKTASTPSSSSSAVGARCRHAVMVQRGLLLSESDALLARMFPSFLQAIGYEWCWSETLRYFRRVEKDAMAQGGNTVLSCLAMGPSHLFPFASSSANTPFTEDVPSLSPVWFAMRMGQWSSKAVIDAVLIAIARRTYPSRLYQLLPGSYHPLLDGLGILPAAGAAEVMAAMEEAEDGTSAMGGAGSSGSNPLVPPTLFVLPPYYEEVGLQVMQYLDRVGTIAAIQLEELDHIVHHHAAVLPMIVRIRAMAPSLPSGRKSHATDGGRETTKLPRATTSTTDEGEEEEEEALLSTSTVEALVARYQAEVLLVAVVVYTQLTVPSQSQALLRTLAPLLERYLLLYTRSLGQVGSPQFPLWMTASATGGVSSSTVGGASASSSSALPATVSCRFSLTVQRVCGEAGYQLYPLEWLPMVGEVYLQHLRRHETASTAMTMSPSGHREESIVGGAHSSFSSSSLPYYSLFAAVAHQLHLSFRTPVGSSGGSATRCVTSVLAMASGGGGGGSGASTPVLMPPLGRSRQESTLYTFPESAGGKNENGGEAKADGEAYPQGRQRVERFTQLMQWVFLDTRDDVVSSVEMAAADPSRRSEAGAAGGHPTHRREEAFFHTFIEVKDFWQVVCQGFLPYGHWNGGAEGKANAASEFEAALYYAQKGTPSSSSSSSNGSMSGATWALRRLEMAWQWCQNVLGSAADEAAVHARCQKIQREWWGKWSEESKNKEDSGSRATTCRNTSFALWRRRGCFFFYDSATLDASLEARMLLRSVPLRLLEKWRWIQSVREEEEEKRKEEVHSGTSSFGATHLNAPPSRVLRELNTASFLLQMQMRQWMEMSERCMDNDGVDASFSFEEEGQEEGVFTRDRKWGVREWWWSSPLFFDELRVE